MNIELDPKHERRLTEMAASQGRSVGEVLGELIDRSLPEHCENGSEAEAEAQRQAIEVMIEEIDQLPLESPNDGFRVEDHDDVIYRRDW